MEIALLQALSMLINATSVINNIFANLVHLFAYEVMTIDLQLKENVDFLIYIRI